MSKLLLLILVLTVIFINICDFDAGNYPCGNKYVVLLDYFYFLLFFIPLFSLFFCIERF